MKCHLPRTYNNRIKAIVLKQNAQSKALGVLFISALDRKTGVITKIHILT